MLTLGTFPSRPRWRRPVALVCIFLSALSPASLALAEPAPSALSGAVPADTSVRTGWFPPLSGPLRVGRKFDPPQYRWLPGHRGVDLCGPVGSEVLAPREGVVVYAARLADRNVVSIEHSDGLRSTFEPVAARVSRGQSVTAGQVVGTLEAGHEGDCLHWGVKRDRDTYLNPLLLLFGPVRLLPLDED